MAIDLEALRKKHEQLSNPGGGGNNEDFLKKFFQIPEGTSVIRILPSSEDDKEFFAETKIHRVPDGNGGSKNIHCRRVHNEKCSLCDLYFALWKTGRKEDEDLARTIKPRNRYYMNVVDRESGEVKILSVGVIIFNKILGTILDDDFGDITNLETGFDFKIVKQMEGQWPKYDQSSARPKSTPAGTKKEIATIMDSLHDIHSLVKLEEYDDVKNAAQALMGMPIEDAPEKEDTEVSDDDYLSKLKS